MLAQRAGEDERGVQLLALRVLDDALDAGERGERLLLRGGALAAGRQVLLLGDGPAGAVRVHPQARHLLGRAVDDGRRHRGPRVRANMAMASRIASLAGRMPPISSRWPLTTVDPSSAT
ncbi:hypothetical protein ACQPXT_02410 [Streptomyces sp. CA-100214]